jgi:glycogen operon protein
MKLELNEDYSAVRLMRPVRYSQGSPLPYGVSTDHTGVNFTLFSRHATRVWLLLFRSPDDASPSQLIELDPLRHRTGDIWHIRIEEPDPQLAYAFRVDGPHEPEKGHRYNPGCALVDPYATALHADSEWSFEAYCSGADPIGADFDARPHPLKNLVTTNHFDWEGDRPLRHHWSDVVIYETHVRGLTIHPSSLAEFPGTFRGVAEMIPHFKSLGITAVELMPLQEFNPSESIRHNPFTGERLRNFWGYNTIAFFAPHQGYSTRRFPGCQVEEFKEMVKALHRADIEVFLDVVFNHTAEGNELGPTLNFRGLDNSVYYLLEDDKRCYKNYSGCGNTLNCNHPVVRHFILDCLRYWVVEMHVDGFRFDLASILGRDRSGSLTANPPLLEKIAEDPILRGVKLIAEAWDAGGAYLVGRFPGERWSEWNGQYRDDVRRFWRGDPGMAGAFAQRLCGSADLYEHSGKAPVNSINFVTCHDGFTLNDLVSYGQKNNWANGEDNRDGADDNHSANFGAEGPTDDWLINRLRKRQMKNFIATLLLSRGVPMLLGGDEFGRTQRGNNNAYCQDNEISWVDWRLLQQNRDFFDFVQGMIAFRRRLPVLSREQFYRPEDLSWFNASGFLPDWTADSVIGCRLHDEAGRDRELCMLFNPTPNPVSFVLPPPPADQVWSKAVDTAETAPFDVCQAGQEIPLFEQLSLLVSEHTLVVLIADMDSRLL